MPTSVVILLAEDEPMIRMNIEETLGSGGYSVISARCGEDAKAVMDEHGFEMAGLVTDIRLGGSIDGWELGRHARELNPQISIVYITGDSAADWPVRGVPRSVMLQKPFANSQLVTAISSLLNDAGTGDCPPESYRA